MLLLWLTLIPVEIKATSQEHLANDPPYSELEGKWVGRMETPNGPMEVRLELTVQQQSAWQAIVELPNENLRAPSDTLTVTDESVQLSIMNGALEFDVARVSEHALEGTLELVNDTLDVRLAHSDSPQGRELKVLLQEAREEHRAKSLEKTKAGDALDLLNRDALNRLLDEAEATHTTALAIRHEDGLVGEWYLDGAPQPIETMSVTKAVLNLAVGRLFKLGKLDSLDTPVHAFYPEWNHGQRAEITLRHLMTHTSGLEPAVPATPIYGHDDYVEQALSAPLVGEPGSPARYNNTAINLLAGIASEAAGEPIDAFLKDDLFAKLDITEFDWARDPAGNPHGMAGLQIKAGDLARLGQVALDRGIWKGERLIHAEWFNQSFRPEVPITESFQPGPPRNDAVGLLWHLLRDKESGNIVGARHGGYLGQWFTLYPDKGLVGVRMVEQSPGYDPENDIFIDFQSLLRELIPSDKTDEYHMFHKTGG